MQFLVVTKPQTVEKDDMMALKADDTFLSFM